MNSLSAMRRVIITTTPALRPMGGHFCEFINEKTAEFGIGAGTSFLLIKYSCVESDLFFLRSVLEDVHSVVL